MANVIFKKFAHHLLTGSIVFPNSVDLSPVYRTKVLLLETFDSSASDPEKLETVQDLLDVAGNAECSAVGTGYVRRDLFAHAEVDLTGPALDHIKETAIKVRDNDPLTWTPSTNINAVGAVVYYDPDYTDTDTQNLLISFMDFGGTRSSVNGDFVLQFDNRGIFELNF